MICKYLAGIALSAHLGISEDLNKFHPQVRLKYKYFFATPLIEHNGAVIGAEYFIGD